MVLTVDDIVTQCQAALDEHTPALAVRDVLDQLVAVPALLEQALGPIEWGGLRCLHNADDLTILRLAWTRNRCGESPPVGCWRQRPPLQPYAAVLTRR
jgi:hypothetical protein